MLSSLAQEPAPPNTVMVTATRSEQPLADMMADVTIIDRAEIERSGAADLVDVLARSPGVSFTRNGGPTGTSSIFLRGAEHRHTAVLIDGVRVDSQSTGGATLQAIPVSQIERIEILRGANAAIYGSDALAGVVQIFTKRGQTGFFPSLQISTSTYNTHEINTSLRGGNDTLDYALTVASAHSEGFNAVPKGKPDPDGYHKKSSSMRLGLKLSDQHKLEFSTLENRQRSDYDDSFSLTQDDQNKILLQTAGIHWKAQWNERWSTRAAYTRSTDRYEIGASGYKTQTQIETWWLHNELKWGASQIAMDVERREDSLTNSTTEPEQSRKHADAVALGYSLRLAPHTLQMHARLDADSEFGDQSSHVAAYGYDIRPGLRVSGSVGTAFRVPTLYQRFSIYGSPALKAETARNTELSLRAQKDTSRASVVIYRNDVENLIDYLSGPGACINGTGSYPGCYSNVGLARLTGITLAGGTQVERMNLGASIDLMNPTNLKTDRLLARRARRQAVLTADRQLSGWHLGAEIQFVGSRFDDSGNTKKLAPYNLLNGSASTPLGSDWRLMTRVGNLSDKKYQSVKDFSTAGRTLYLGLTWAPH